MCEALGQPARPDAEEKGHCQRLISGRKTTETRAEKARDRPGPFFVCSGPAKVEFPQRLAPPAPAPKGRAKRSSADDEARTIAKNGPQIPPSLLVVVHRSSWMSGCTCQQNPGCAASHCTPRRDRDRMTGRPSRLNRAVQGPEPHPMRSSAAGHGTSRPASRVIRGVPGTVRSTRPSPITTTLSAMRATSCGSCET